MQNNKNKARHFLNEQPEVKQTNFKARKKKKGWVFSCALVTLIGAQMAMPLVSEASLFTKKEDTTKKETKGVVENEAIASQAKTAYTQARAYVEGLADITIEDKDGYQDELNARKAIVEGALDGSGSDIDYVVTLEDPEEVDYQTQEYLDYIQFRYDIITSHAYMNNTYNVLLDEIDPENTTLVDYVESERDYYDTKFSGDVIKTPEQLSMYDTKLYHSILYIRTTNAKFEALKELDEYIENAVAKSDEHYDEIHAQFDEALPSWKSMINSSQTSSEVLMHMDEIRAQIDSIVAGSALTDVEKAQNEAIIQLQKAGDALTSQMWETLQTDTSLSNDDRLLMMEQVKAVQEAVDEAVVLVNDAETVEDVARELNEGLMNIELAPVRFKAIFNLTLEATALQIAHPDDTEYNAAIQTIVDEAIENVKLANMEESINEIVDQAIKDMNAVEPSEVVVDEEDQVAIPLYRMYNANDGEHLYTLSTVEVSFLEKHGWTNESKEDPAWYTPDEGRLVFRLYNPNSGEHFYTDRLDEYLNVSAAGWNPEGIAFYSAKVDNGVPVYRDFNPNAKGAGSHLFTTSQAESDLVVDAGWEYEGIAFYGVNVEDDEVVVDDETGDSTNDSTNDSTHDSTQDLDAE